MSLNRPHCIRDGPRDTELSCEGQVRDVDEANAEWYKKDCEEFDGRKSEEKSWSFVVDCCFGSLLCAGTEIQCDSKLLCQASKYQTSADYLLQSLLWHPGHTATFAWCERGITEKPLLRVHLCTRGFTLYCMLRHAAITACALQKMPCYILMSGGGGNILVPSASYVTTCMAILCRRGSRTGVHAPLGVHLPIWRGTLKVSNRREKDIYILFISKYCKL